MKKLFPLLFAIILLSSCGGDGFNAEVERNKIFDIHDEVMPKISEVMALKKQVEEKAKTLSEAEADALYDLGKELDEARNGMMSWMRDWSSKSGQYMEMKNGAEEQKAYLAAEMEKVRSVKEAINGSIQKAKAALK